MNYSFESFRMGFRPLTIFDQNFLYDLDGDPAVMKFVETRRAKNMEEVKATLARIMDRNKEWNKSNYGLWVAEDKETRETIGWFALKPLPGYPDIELGYRLKKKFWGNGYATEGGARLLQMAFFQLGLLEVCAITDPEHKASQQVLKKLGFVHVDQRPYQSPNPGTKPEQVDFFLIKKADLRPT
ncbi:MAG: GNAT family N-acetyltransferase [Bdellovibrionota bacterium]